MARPAKFTDDQVLDAALAGVARSGHAVTVTEVAGELGGPVGSIYHRFSSRDVLLASLWLRSVQRFQAGLFELAASGPAGTALVECALHVPRYCRAHPDEARALTLFRQTRLLDDCPAELEDQVAHVNDDLLALTRRLTRERYGRADRRHTELVGLATRVAPYGLVRPHLGRAVPKVVDEAVEASATAILACGDG
ncbi:TetR/AcrR family transcriptional regulator [Nocardioides sp.]|uniref:TetR/AcrR family transcriptional regulator n=1 Tax=Nocardioides sp. TaxID=35761 RepID=UPI0035291657